MHRAADGRPNEPDSCRPGAGDIGDRHGQRRPRIEVVLHQDRHSCGMCAPTRRAGSRASCASCVLEPRRRQRA